MPKIIRPNTSKIYLPSTEDLPEAEKAFVIVKDRLTGGDWVAAALGKDDAARTELGLVQYIVDWNFTEDGTPNTPKLPINQEWIHNLPLKDFNFLAKKMTEASKDVVESTMNDEQKKTSSSTLTSSTTPTIPTPTVPGSPQP